MVVLRMAQDNAQGVWLPLAEAAERSGYHKEALRARAKRGGLQIRRNNLGHMLVLMPPEMLNGAQVSAQLSNGHDAQAAQVSNAHPAQADRELVDELRNRVAVLEERLEAERRAHLEARDRAATAEATSAAYLQSLQDLATRLDVAHAELALARRSWWRRLFG
jgi:hypothetical protein